MRPTQEFWLFSSLGVMAFGLSAGLALLVWAFQH